MILYAPGSENFFGGFVRWDSDDAAIAANRPLLTVQFPEPTGAAAMLLFGAGMMLFKPRARRAP